MQRVRNLFRSATLVSQNALAEALELLRAMGVPAMIAPSEGEAQGVQLVQAGQAVALYAPDYDSLLCVCPTVVHGLDSARGKIEVLRLTTVLHALDLTRAQLVDLGILVGTDFNPACPESDQDGRGTRFTSSEPLNAFVASTYPLILRSCAPSSWHRR